MIQVKKQHQPQNHNYYGTVYDIRQFFNTLRIHLLHFEFLRFPNFQYTTN